jgi:hypothetical protein
LPAKKGKINKKLSPEQWADFGEKSQRKVAIIATQSEKEEFSEKQTYQRENKKNCRVCKSHPKPFDQLKKFARKTLIVWPIREPRELLITTPESALGNFEESRSSPSKSSHASEKHHFLCE